MLHWEIMQLRLVIGLVVLLSMGAVVGLAHEVLTPDPTARDRNGTPRQ